MHTGLSEFSSRLAGLPGFQPPAGIWQEILDRRGQRESAAFPRVPVALAAAVLAAVAGMAWNLQPTQPDLASASQTAPAAAAAASDPVHVENARLETLLAALPERHAMRGSTAYTIAQLEDRLALVDDRLSRVTLEPNAPERAERLWRERVELMNSLVHVRYADLASPF